MHDMNNINDLGQCRYGHITSTTHVSEEAAAAGRLSNFHGTGYYAPDDRYVMDGTERAFCMASRPLLGSTHRST